ncbi:aldo/keto reductase [Anoxybacterium hadale]|uniref:Aldo/keto reductase n=1 Tax=Anoxybacterium hadale TaxID=3408580 RepID=A0ACD1A8M4_9FIRM|nr:aldo/keto reductase [Clostridiales bacterium]
MKKNILGNTGLQVTEVGFGVLTVGKTQLNMTIDEGAAVLRYGLERGINFLDTAEYYETYPYIRKALKGTSFEPVIASKSLGRTYQSMDTAIEEARSALDRDVIDIFLLHEVREDPDFDSRAGAWECLQEAKTKGIVKSIGLSTHHVDVAAKASKINEIDVLFPLVNLQSLGIRNGTGFGTKEEMAEEIKNASQMGKGVFAMKVFGGGNLVGRYQEAIQYVRSLEGISSMMVGFGYNHEIDRIIEAVEGSLEPSYVPDLTAKKIQIDQGDCEGCGNCIVRCPNGAIYRNDQGLAAVNHSICLTCGYCAPVCPVRAIIMF